MNKVLPNDLLINARDEVTIRKHLALVALGKRPADRAIRVGRLLDVHGNRWHDDQELVVSGRRIAWVGPSGAYPGEVGERVDRRHLSAVPGFGEVHKHIESSHLTPEWEAALVLPSGCTWTCEASHEFSNVDGEHNLEFWMTARRAGSPAKIFPLPGLFHRPHMSGAGVITALRNRTSFCAITSRSSAWTKSWTGRQSGIRTILPTPGCGA